jgi:hypothetical protein
MGRRRSIERTTARRCPSVRMRPGLGELPAPGSGRQRARLGGGAMTLLRRTPREVYRLFDEDEFFAGADRVERRERAITPPGGRRLRRIAGTTTLLAAMGATGGVIALNRMVAVGGAGRPLTSGMLAGLGSSVPSRVGPRRAWPHAGAARTRRLGSARRQTSRVATTTLSPPATAVDSEQPQRVTPAPRLTPAAQPDRAARTSSSPQRSGQSEFGFER